MRNVPCLLAQTCVRTCGRRRDAEALDGPGLRRRRSFVSVRLAPIDLAEQDDDGSLDGGLLTEEPVETDRDLLVRKAPPRPIRSAPAADVAPWSAAYLGHQSENGRAAFAS